MALNKAGTRLPLLMRLGYMVRAIISQGLPLSVYLQFYLEPMEKLLGVQLSVRLIPMTSINSA